MEAKEIDGIREDYTAWREDGRVVVLDGDGEEYFTLPISFEADAINTVIAVARRMFERGQRAGDFAACSRICAALRIDGPKFPD
ncbi:hypothetical protein [Burkholderia ambifaria]|uniref:hypothetical protein n=1 Tax=Burkholderia ambifaria TaxID=152480 RepID=UPI0015895AE1|nr:hypothetical protein [Burkholderia ambifaria]